MHLLRRAFFLLMLLGLAPVAWAGIDVQIDGLKGAALDNVRQRLGIVAAAERTDLDDALVQRLNEQAPDDIRTALQPFGYYSPDITFGALQKTNDGWTASYHITQGPPTLITRLDISADGEGKDFADIQKALSDLPLKLGAPLLHADYEAAKAQLLSAAYDAGYLDVKFEPSELRVTPETQSAEITLKLQTGPRYYIGPVTLELEKLDRDNVQRYITIQEGEPFSPKKVLDTQFALSDLNYFQTVEIEPRRDLTQNQHIPITIHTTLRKNARYQFGAGYGTDTGARGIIGAEFRRINDYGHKVLADLRLSQIKNAITGEYRIPVGEKATDNLSFTTTYTQEKIADTDSRKFTLGTALYRTPGFWQRRLYLDFAREYSTISGLNTKSDLLMPGLALTHSTLDDPIYARLGWSSFLDVHGASDVAVSDASFLQWHAILRGVIPLGDRARLMGRAEMAGSWVPDFADLPASQRLYAGGDQSVRGYAYQSIGPRDSTGQVVGGKYLSVFSVESDYRIYEEWGIAAFYDLGGAANNPSPDLLSGAGLGVRYRAPFGDVRVDLAHPFDDPGTAVRLHIGIRVGL